MQSGAAAVARTSLTGWGGSKAGKLPVFFSLEFFSTAFQIRSFDLDQRLFRLHILKCIARVRDGWLTPNISREALYCINYIWLILGGSVGTSFTWILTATHRGITHWLDASPTRLLTTKMDSIQWASSTFHETTAQSRWVYSHEMGETILKIGLMGIIQLLPGLLILALSPTLPIIKLYVSPRKP